MYYFPEVSLLITHYKRINSLEHLLNSFEKLNCKFGEIIISDDGSGEECLNYIKNILSKKFDFKLITTPTNRGLGNNINKGQDAVEKPFTLYVQEDFEPQTEFPGVLEDSLKMIKDDLSLDMVKYYAYYTFPYLKPLKSDSRFSLMHIPAFALKYTKIYYYSDHPHLRRSSFFSKFGRYKEGLKVDRTEYAMCISVLQNKAKAIFYNQFDELFLQRNSTAEPSTTNRGFLSMSNNFFVKTIRDVYRQVRYNSDILFRKNPAKIK